MKQSQNTLNEWTVFESRLQATIVNYMKKLWNGKKSHITSDAKIFVGLNLTFKKVFNKKIKTNKWVLTHWSTNLMVERSFNPAFRSERCISLRLSKSYKLKADVKPANYYYQIMKKSYLCFWYSCFIQKLCNKCLKHNLLFVVITKDFMIILLDF